MVEIRRYTSEDKKAWDSFVENSKNGTFLLKRDYMEYHADRFEDHSLLILDQKKHILALLPANKKGDTLYSHQGLTYGGLILAVSTSLNDVMEIFEALKAYMNENGFSSLLYKQIPSIYHRCPAEEDDYALWRNGATLEVCNIATTIPLHTPLQPKVEKCRRRRLNQASEHGFNIVEDASLTDFWPLLLESLSAHHDAKPVHTLEEMQLLQSRFPENIKCMIAQRPDGSAAGGVVLYITREVVHIQYGHASLQGYEEHVMEFIYFYLLEKYRNDGHTLYLDFGTSNEQAGQYLNANLVSQKEGFGGRSIAYRQFRLKA